MSTSFAQYASTKQTPQTQVIPGRAAEMTANDAGGYVFKLDKWAMLRRFLILGSEGGSFQVTEKMTIRACESLTECVKENAKRVVDILSEISDEGRAKNNDYALFALAFVMAHASTDADKYYARQRVNTVARIGTHILHFAEFIDQLKGWGTGTRKAFKEWFLTKSPADLAFQFIKYQQRDGWSQRDILRKAHPVGSPEQNAVFNYITKKDKKDEAGNNVITNVSDLPSQLQVFHRLSGMSEKGVIEAIQQNGIPREAIPTEMLNSIDIWKALLPRMGLTALIRNLGKLSTIKLTEVGSQETAFIVKSLTDFDRLKRDRVHPMQLLFAMKTYASGKGFRGSNSWVVSSEISAALEQAFEFSFSYVEPSGKKHMLALDVSGSMHSYAIANSNVTCREAAVALALITAKHEKDYRFMGFSSTFIPLDDRIRADMSFKDAMASIAGLPFERTDCSLPMTYATENKIDVDVFSVYTDNETYAGRIHPVQALDKYRRTMNKPNAKLVVIGMLGSPFTIADPKDPNSMDLVGFDADTPQLLSAFAAM